MEVIARRDGSFALLDEWNFRAFKLTDASGSDNTQMAAMLSAIGRLEPDGAHAWLGRGWVVSLLSSPPSAEWLEEFDRMVAVARAFGWIDDEDMIRTHVERCTGPAME